MYMNDANVGPAVDKWEPHWASWSPTNTMKTECSVELRPYPIGTYMHVYAYVHIHICIYVFVNSFAYPYMTTTVYVYMHACMHTYIHTYMHAYIDT